MEKFELTFPQKNIWLVENFYESKLINIISGSLIIKKDFEISKAEQTVNKFVEINEGMRIRICVENSIPKQYVTPFVPFESDKINVEGKTEQEIDKIKEEYISTGFDVIEKPLFSYLLMDRGNGVGEIFLKAHHLICDGWSGSKMVMGLAKIYDGILEGKTEFEASPSYLDYIAKEKDYTTSEKFAADETFWNEYLKDFNETVSIKNAYLDDSNAKRYTVKLNERLNKLILDYCKENKFSPFTIFMTALAIYLERTTEKQDIVIGTPILNRSNFAEKQMQGMFVSTMPVRFKIDEQMTFKELCSSNAKETMSLFRHQRFPISKTIDNLKKNNGLEQAPYKVMVSYQNARATFDKQDTYRMSWNFSGHIQDELEIHIVDLNDDGILEIDYDYITSLFKDIEIEYIAKRLETIIQDGIVNDSTIVNIEIMSKEEKEKILNNITKCEYPASSITELFKNQVNKTPNNIAIVYNNQQVTYSMLDKLSNSVANYLLNNNIGNGDIVAMMQSRGINMIATILGIMKSGATYLPIDIEFPIERVNFIIDDCKAKCVIKDNSVSLEHGVNVEDIVNGDDSYINNSKMDSLAYIIYTSGTTGNPKGVAITHRSLSNLLYAMEDVKHLSECEVALSQAKYTFDMFIIETILPIVLGLKMVIASDEQTLDPNKLLDIIKENKVQVMFITPTKLNMLLNVNQSKQALANIKKLTVAGEVFPDNLLNRIRQITDTDIFNGYGPTEATVCTTIHKVENSNVTIGKCINNTFACILDSKERLMPLGISGELCIGGAGLFKEYINNNQETAKKTTVFRNERLYKSGDKCKLNFDLDFEYAGRLDGQVKLNGLRIELEEIEKNINKLKNVEASAVCTYNNILVAFVKTLGTIDEIKGELSKTLPDYMVPKYIQKIDTLPLASTGKIDKKQLVKSFNVQENAEENVIYNKLQQEIFDIIAKIVNIKRNISIDENLIKYGLDSLSIIELTLKLNDKYETNISPKQLFSGLTIKHIEDCINANKTAGDEDNIHTTNSELIPISDIQKELFVAYKMDTESTLYNMPGEVVFKNIDVDRLKTSVEKCLNNNLVFKTNIVINDTKPYLKVLEKDIIITVEKIGKEEYIKVRETFVKPFDLLNDTLVRCNIFDVEGVCYLLYDSHHIIMDGISMGNLIKQIEKEYNGESLDYTYSFLDYLKETNKRQDSSEAENYFLNMLAGKEISTTIDTDFKREAKRYFEGSRENICIGETLSNKVKECSKVLATTENSIFLAALKILLSKYTYSQDVILGLAVSGRKQMKHLPLVGMFVNTVPMAEHISSETKVKEYIMSTQNTIFDSVEYAEYSLEKLTNKLEIKKDSSRNSIFDIVYTYQGFDTNKAMFNKDEIQVSSLANGISKFDITFEIVPSKEDYKISIEYCQKLYKESTIKSLLKNYTRCIESVLENINGSISDISIVKFINKSECASEVLDIVTTFKDVVNKYPNNTAVIHNNESITYKELDNKSTEFARHLASKGVTARDVVAIMMDKSIDLLISILGILKCGAAYLPIDYELSDERIKFMLDDSKTHGVVTKHNIMNHKSELKQLEGYNYIFFEDLKNEQDTDNYQISVANILAEDISYVMYTSGSTGKPKGVMNTHQGVVRLVKGTNYIEVEPSDVVALSGTIVFDASVFETWAALLNGATLDIIDKEELLDIVKFEDHINKDNINIMLLTSALFAKFGLNKPEMFKNVKYLLTGGDVFSCKAGANVINTCPNTKVINAYGPTENSVIATTYEYDDSSVTIAPIGKAITNTDCYILDKYYKPVPVGAVGELYLSGIGVAKGYINNENLTKERFVKLPLTSSTLYKTGDIVKYDEDYNIVFKGRQDNQIKIRGFRVEIEEIVAAINSIYGVKSSYVMIRNFNDNKQIYGYIAVEDKELHNEKYIRNNLRNKIPYYMQPKFIILLENLPYTINGKVDKQALALLNPEVNNSLEKPRNDLENKVYKIWSKLLCREDFGINDNFFEIGGDSLLATEFVIQCTNQNMNYSYADIYNHPTIKQLCEGNSFDLDKIYSLKAYNMPELNEEAKKLNVLSKDNRKDILITGATGFLGSHVLACLLDNLTEGQKIYCIIREKLDVSPLVRLKDRMKFFFENKYDNLIDNNVIVLEGDIAKKNIIYDKSKEKEVIKNVGKIIHTAAYVKHFDDKDMFEKLNVEGTKNIATFCLKNNIRLYNVSTLSVCGNMLEGGQVEQDIDVKTKFDETSLFIGQKLYNAYVYSKFLAELEILKLCKKGLVATNIRTGNLTGRYSDGKFQPNVEQNAFANRIKAFLSLKVIPESFEDMYLEFTPIDCAADAIVKLVQDNNDQPRTIHLFNHNHLMLDEFITHSKVLNINLKMIEDEKFKAVLKENIVSHNEDMNGIIIDLNNKNEIKYTSNIIVDSKITIEYLANRGFMWPNIDETYVVKYIEYLKEIGFI